MKHPKDLRAWADLLKRTRAFFDARDYLEVTTNHVVPCGAFEASLDVFEVPGLGQLHTSPEMEMKVLLSEYRKSIYQVCRCFRDDPVTDSHNPEFTMLEFYKVGASYGNIIEEMKNFLRSLSNRELEFEERTFDELLEEHSKLRFSWSEKELRQKANLVLDPDDSHSDIIFKAWIEQVEPALNEGPIIVKDYPAPFAALAAVHGEHAERFEIYWKGLEICNGCRELASPKDLMKRYEVESTNRKAKGPHPEPKRLHQALSTGLPDCAGVAVGLERVYFCLNPQG